METHVWIATKRYSPFQQSEERILGLEGETLTVRGEGGTWSSSLSDIELRFPRSMLGAGFELIVGGGKLYFWFYDPFTGRDAMLKGSDQDEATIENATSFFEGRKAAKPWLQALRPLPDRGRFGHWPASSSAAAGDLPPEGAPARLAGVVVVVTSRIEKVRRRSGEEGAAGLLRRGVLRDSDRLAISLETLTLGLRGYRLRVGGSSPPRHQLLHGIHDRILVRRPRAPA